MPARVQLTEQRALLAQRDGPLLASALDRHHLLVPLPVQVNSCHLPFGYRIRVDASGPGARWSGATWRLGELHLTRDLRRGVLRGLNVDGNADTRGDRQRERRLVVGLRSSHRLSGDKR